MYQPINIGVERRRADSSTARASERPCALTLDTSHDAHRFVYSIVHSFFIKYVVVFELPLFTINILSYCLHLSEYILINYHKL